MSLHEKIPGFIILFVAVQNEFCKLFFIADATQRWALFSAEADTGTTTSKFPFAGLITRRAVTALPAFARTLKVLTSPTTRFLHGPRDQ